MSMQLILRIAGIAALVISALFALLAVHYYLTQDIRAVMDDLSGKARARSVAGTRKRAREASRSAAARPGRAAATPAPVRQGEVEEAPQASQAPFVVSAPTPAIDEDDLGTILVAAASQGARRTDGGTMVFGEVTGAAAPAAAQKDSQTMDVPAQADDATGVDPAVFRLTRSVVMIHSQEVIAVSGEQQA